MTSVRPNSDHVGKSSSKDKAANAELLHKPSYQSPSFFVNLVLNGHSFEVTKDTCKKIPLLRDTLFGLENPELVRDQNDKTTRDVTTTTVRRNSYLESVSVLTVADDLNRRNLSSSKGEQQQYPSPPKTVEFVSATVPECPQRVPDAGVLFSSKGSDDQGITLRFQRSANVFEAILDFAQTGELHVPGHVCPQLFVRDLGFWGLEISDLEPCCYPKLVSFLEEQKTVMRFHRSYSQDPVLGMDEREASGGDPPKFLFAWRRSTWLFLTDPWSSLSAKVYFVIVCLMIMTSFFVMASSTTTRLTRPLTRDEWMDYLGDDFDDYEEHIDYFYDDDSPSSSGSQTTTTLGSTLSTGSTTRSSVRYNPRALINWIQYLSYACTTFLALDYLLRILFCPSLRRFFVNVINIADGIALAATFAKYAIDSARPEEMYKDTIIDIINVLQLLRVLRFLGPMSKVTGFRVIYLTLRSCLTELLLLLALVGFLVMVFSVLLYYLGEKKTITSIPVAMWYALVTITTVGYGDIVPDSFGTKIIGCVCAIIGVMFLAMTLPIVVNNFFSLYVNCSVVPPSLKKQNRAKKAWEMQEKEQD